MAFNDELTALLNTYNWDAQTNTPDYQLANEIEALLQSKVIVDPEPEPDPDTEVETPIGPPTPPTDG